ncbi:hypothetical protein F5Y05DRAFT_20966 [Hypoxylon sp. FL0543]|nr:hypothetical protein F5Y05DRAFT_20966 [Hypoxylon sp. FL0543]
MPPPLLPVRCTRAYSSSSLATIFTRLLHTSSPSPVSSSNSILDVLLPPRARAFHLPTAAARVPRQPPATLRSRSRHARLRNNGSASVHVTARRPFSATAAWRKTQVVYNPQKDEDGNDMLLEITPRAAQRLSKIMEKDKNPNLALRISVESGGCHGFQYLMSLTTLPPTLPSASTSASASSSSTDTSHLPPETSSSPPNPANPDAEKTAPEVAPSTTTSASPSAPSIGEDDTIFEWVPDTPSPSPSSSPSADTRASLAAGEPAFVPGTPKVILDAPSLELLKGSKIDFTMELIGSQFKVVDNPAATSSCGCGTSFDIKF